MSVAPDAAQVSFFENEPMFIVDYYTSEIIDVNRSASERYGFTAGEFKNKKLGDLGTPLSELNGKKSAGRFPDAIYRHFTKEGETFYVQLTDHAFKHGDRLAKLYVAHRLENFSPDSGNDTLFPRADALNNYLPMGILEWDGSYNVRLWGGKASEIFGYEESEIIGKPIQTLPIFPDYLKEQVETNLDHYRDKAEAYFTIDSRHETKSGETIYCRWHNAAIYNSDGELMQAFSMVEDISENKLAAKKLKESETRFRVLTEASFVGIYMLQDQKFRYVNPRLCEMAGYSEEEIVNKISPADMLHPDEIQKFRRLQKFWLNRKIDSFEVEFRINTKYNETLYIKTFGSSIEINNKPAVIGVAIDETSQHKAAEEVKKSLESYRTLFDSITDSIYIQGRNGTFIEVNKGAEKMYGYSKEEMIGKDPSMLAAPGKVDLEATKKLVEEAYNGKPNKFNWWGRRKNGDIFPKEVKLSKGQYFGEDVVIAVARDITEQYERDQILRQNEQLFRQLFQNSPLAIAMLDGHGDVKMLNKGFEKLFGYTLKELEGVSLDKVIVPGDKLDEASKLSGSKKTFRVKTVRQSKSGDLINVLIYGVPVKLESQTIAIYGIYVDITDQIKAEKQIKSSLKEKEVLLSEIHHRVKNNLAVITGLLELQSHRLDNPDAENALRDSQMRIHSMALIHEKLYQSKNLSQIEFGKYTRELVNVIKSSHLSSDQCVEIELDCDKVQMPITTAIPCGLLINEIVTNALKHAFVGIKNPEIKLSIHVKDERVKLSVTDNGIGLPKPFEKLNKKSLGVVLIRTLCKQLNAMLEVDGSNGTEYNIEFELHSEVPV